MTNMQSYRTRVVGAVAAQWNGHGEPIRDMNGIELGMITRYEPAGIAPSDLCVQCYCSIHSHGWINTIQGGHIVHPGDYIIEESDGSGYYPCRESIFLGKYQKA